MILTESVAIKINSKLIKFYENKGYKFKYGDLTTILVKDLSIGSHVMVEMQCDKCEKTHSIRYGSLKDKETYSWNCQSCISKNLCGKGLIGNSFKDSKIQTELANRNKPERLIKSQKTKEEKYGDKNYTNRTKRSKTMLNTYGKDNYSNPEKRHETMISKYGGLFNNQDKRKNTCLEKYGVDSPSKVPEIFHKMQVSAFKLKKFKNYELFYRGSYEYNFLELCEKNNTIHLISNSKSIKYIKNKKECVYYPDFYFKKYNLIIEIKSDYTFKRDLKVNKLKRKACINQGYEFIFIIDNKFNKFKALIQ